jgi:hypothetical protein
MQEMPENVHTRNRGNKMINESWGKFYAKTFTGSMRGAGAHVIALMSYCIAHAKPPDGELEINPEVVAFLIGEPVERMQNALNYLLAEDGQSRSPAESGRRLIRTGQYSYRLVNWLAHREGIDEDARRAYWREKQKGYRAKAAVAKPKIRRPSKKKFAEADESASRNGPLSGETSYLAAEAAGASQKQLDRMAEPQE